MKRFDSVKGRPPLHTYDVRGRDPQPGEACLYRLLDDDGVVRYVGCTTLPLRRRLSCHRRQPKTNVLRQWIEGQHSPVLEALIYVPHDQAMELERVAVHAATTPLLNIYKRPRSSKSWGPPHPPPPTNTLPTGMFPDLPRNGTG